jgi:hypothetical protein
MRYVWILTLTLFGMTMVGCNRDQERKGVNINAPGVNVQVDKGGVDVKAPGVNVTVPK